MEKPNFRVVDPATGAEGQSYAGHTDTEAAAVIAATHAAWTRWRTSGFAERRALMAVAADILDARCDRYAALMAHEMGKPVASGRAEIEKCAWVCRYYAEEAEGFLATESLSSDAAWSGVAYRPLGPVLAVMPWNFPFWQVFRFAAPALMAGNAGLLKHASNVPGCALAIEDVFRTAGFPDDVFRTLLISSHQVAAVIQNPHVVAVTLTGSGPAGRAVAREAGACLKKTVLELGGSDPYLILEDADLDRAAEAGATSRLLNSGQSCIAAKRFVVVDAVYDAFLDRLCNAMSAKPMGDPEDESTVIGPQARIDLRDELHDQVERSIAGGARLVLGGVVPDRPGAWYPATVLADVGPDAPAYREELFGPVATVIRADDEADAIRIANDTSFGLGAAVFTQDEARGRRIAEFELAAGCCFVNGFVKSDPRLPFGGIGESGYGRELSAHGIREFCNAKTVYVA